MNKEKLFKLISSTYSDSDVSKDEELKKILFDLSKELDSTEDWKLICVKLNNKLSRYLLTHKLKAPRAVEQLLTETAKYAEQYRGLASTSIWMSNFFS